jgi:hypothetical protein
MALPRNVQTPRNIELQAKVDAAGKSLAIWPMLTKDDYVLVGGIIVMYSYVEFNLRRLAEVFDHAGLLPAKWKDRAMDLDIGQVEEAVQATPVWAGPDDVEVLKALAALRPSRNLLAHFTIRRFPDDDAFLFVTKNAKDYERVLGKKPANFMSMTAIVERDALLTVLKQTEHILGWVAKVAAEFENRLLPNTCAAVPEIPATGLT